DLPTALLLPYLDGSAEVAELAEDVASALDRPLDDILAIVEPQLAQLRRAGAVHDTGFHPEGSEALADVELADTSILDISDDGDQVTVLRQLPNGRKLRTVSIRVKSSNTTDALR